MLNNHLFSNVNFVVRKSDGENESKQVIPTHKFHMKFLIRQSDGESESKQVILAHKFVLSIGSPVFEALFYGELAETIDY